jgi:hypothetical protein
MIDAERHRIRWKFVCVTRKLIDHEHCRGTAHRLASPTRNDFVTETLAVIAFAWSLFAGNGPVLLHLLLLVVPAAIMENVVHVSAENGHGSHDDQKAEAHE